jgi:hypothetical protein
MVPSSSASQPGPPSGVEQLGMLIALRFHGVGSWYAMLKQSKKTPSIMGAAASGPMIRSMKKSRALPFATFQIGFQHLFVGGLRYPSPICSHALIE